MVAPQRQLMRAVPFSRSAHATTRAMPAHASMGARHTGVVGCVAQKWGKR